jgi:hypothetical protein
MAIREGSTVSSIELLSRYFVERMLTLRIGLLYLLLASSGILACAQPARQVHGVALMALLYLVALRIWDDLADRAHDRVHHPQRILVRHTQRLPFIAVLTLLLALLGWLLFRDAGPGRVAWLLAGLLVLSLAYLASARWSTARPLRQAVVLLKYPLFVLLVSGRPGDTASELLALVAWVPPLVAEVHGEGRRVLGFSLAFLALALVGLLLLRT